MTIPKACAVGSSLVWAGVAVTVIAVAVSSSFGQLQPVFLILVLAVVLTGFSRTRLIALTCLFFVSESVVQLLKRAVYLLGSQPLIVYYGVQLLPTVMLVLALAACARRLPKDSLPPSMILLGLFLVLAIATTLASPVALPWIARLAAIHQQILPFAMFFVGACLPLWDFQHVGRTMAFLAILSVAYAVIQFFTGPTSMDIAWAKEAFEYSIQASKVHGFLLGSSTEFRPFSYYADPLTWGLFLLGAFVALAVCRSLGVVSRPYFATLLGIILLGLFLTLTRTPWIGFLSTVTVFILLGIKHTRRPWLLIITLIIAFAAVLWGGGYLLDKYFVPGHAPSFENKVLTRYSTLGTLSARMSAWSLLVRTISSYPIFGTGYGYSIYYSGRLADVIVTDVMESHNYIVELALYTGLPGLFLFFGFYFSWLREGLTAIRNSSHQPLKKALRWIVAFSVGSMITGYFNGPNFMTYFYFLIMGLLSGYAWRSRTATHASSRGIIRSTLGANG